MVCAKLMLVAISGCLICATAHCEPFSVPATGRGIKQGPLLLIDQIREACEAFVAGGPTPTTDTPADGIVARLKALHLPPVDLETLPEAPGVDKSGLVFTPPFPNGCCTTRGGSGRAEVSSGADRGAFTAQLTASGGQYAYMVASPCLVFKAPVSGLAHCETAIVLNGAFDAEDARAGEPLIALGPWIAHCHPKDKGRFSQSPAYMLRGVNGRTILEGNILRHRADFPVQQGVAYKVGTGLWAACAATGNASVGARLSGQLAYFTVRFLPQD